MDDQRLDYDLGRTLAERPAFVSTALGGEHMAVAHSLNPTGRDFVVGDIHGIYHKLQQMLDQLSFDEERDRLFAIGDLIDRGPHSELTAEWLRKPWFYSIRGNHDQFLLDATAHGGMETSIWHMNGGDWPRYLENGDEVVDDLATLFAQLPLAMDVETERGTVGLVHADVPEDRTWESFKGALVAGERADCAIAIWNRRRVMGAEYSRAYPNSEHSEELPAVTGDVYRILCGHARVDDVLPMQNMLVIDTGAAYTKHMERARFSMVQIAPDDWRLYEFLTGNETARVTELPLPAGFV